LRTGRVQREKVWGSDAATPSQALDWGASPGVFLIIAAQVLISSGLWFAGLEFDPLYPLVVMSLALVIGVGAMTQLGSSPVLDGRGERRWWRASYGLLLLALGASFACHLYLLPPLMFSPYPPSFRPLAAAAAIVLCTWLMPNAPGRLVRWRFPALVTLFLLMGGSVLLASPALHIDVYVCQQLAAKGLLSGRNPYELLFPNPYPHNGFVDPSLLVQGQISFYQYPP